MRKIIIALLTLFLTIIIFIPLQAENSRTVQARTYFEDKSQFMELSRMHLDVVFQKDNYFEIITDLDELEKLRSLGYKCDVVHDDLKAFYRSRLEPDKDMGGYMTLSEINTATEELVNNYPDIVSHMYEVGLTLEGRYIYAVCISDNPNIDEDEPEVLFTAAIHAREVITPLVLFNYADYLTENYATDPDVQELVDNTEIWLIFCCNPDGYYYNEVTDPSGGGLWRKNRRNNFDGSYGVDLNRNWGYQWGYDDDGSSPYGGDETYRGSAAFSEPETQSLRDFHLAHEFQISVYLHSYSNLVIWPWGYDSYYTEDEGIFTIMGDSCATWNGYDAGATWITIYEANGGSDDWIYGEQLLKNKTFAFTFEIGSQADGFWPSTSRIPALISENLDPLLFLTEVADHIYQLLAPEQPVLIVPDSIDEGQTLTVEWTHSDILNPAVEFELVELTDLIQTSDSASGFDYCENNDFSISTTRSYSGPSSFFSGAEDDIYRYVQYEFPFAVESGDTLRFWTWYDIESGWDYGYVEVSTDGVSYTAIMGNITTAYNPHGNNRGYGITGTSSGWVQGKFNLSAYAGQSVYIRLSYETDSYTTEEGIYFDDISPVCSFQNQTTLTLPESAFSQIYEDMTEGLYYYKIRAKDAENQWSSYSPIQTATVYYVPQYVCGDVNADDVVNVSDAVSIINYIFIGGSAPEPIERADGNCDEIVNVSDAVKIINYIFIGGDAPCDIDGDAVPDC